LCSKLLRGLGPGSALNEVEDQDHDGNNQKYVYESAADIGKQAEKPKNCDDDGYPKQHENLLLCFGKECLVEFPPLTQRTKPRGNGESFRVLGPLVSGYWRASLLSWPLR
jgi:hypothetical protein